MLNTIASLVTGAMIMAAPVMNESNTVAEKTATTVEVSESYINMSYAVNAHSTFDELEIIRSSAEEAGIGFNYKQRGVKTRLVIDMVIEYEDDYELQRLVVREEDGTKYVKWTVDESGKAVSFKERADARSMEF